MKAISICKCVLAIAIFALATLMNGCHGFSADW